MAGVLHPDMLAAMEADRRLRPLDAASGLAAERAAGLAAAGFWRVGLPEMARIEDRHADGPAGPVPVRVYTPSGAQAGSLPLVMLVHGGAFIAGSIAQAEPVALALADTIPAIVVSTTYRLAPEHPFPASPDDVGAALRWAATTAPSLGADPARIALVGISAGANLAVDALLQAGIAARAAALVYGWFDLAGNSASHARFGDGAFGLTTARLAEAARHYVPSGVALDHPRISPLRADLTAMPETLLVVAECDPLADDSRAMADRLAGAGVPAEVSLHQGMAHGFITKGRLVAAAREAVAGIAAFLRPRLAEGAPPIAETR